METEQQEVYGGASAESNQMKVLNIRIIRGSMIQFHAGGGYKRFMKDKDAINNSRVPHILDEIEIKLLDIYGSRLKKIILYGSFARGEETAGSDLDVMVLLDMEKEAIKEHSEQVLDLAVDLTTRYGIVISIQENNIDFFSEWADTLPFFHNVISEGVGLYGQ